MYPATQEPTYIHIDSFRFHNNLGNGAASTAQINSVWAYYNYQLVGVFDLPVTFPIIATGSGQLMLSPGISVDGLNSFLTEYSFYQPDTSLIVAQPGKIDTVHPVSQYYTGFTCINVASSGFSSAPGANVQIIYNKPPLDYYQISLSNPDDSCESYTTDYVIDQNVDAYLELDYNSTNTFYLGAQANLAGSGVVNLVYLAGVYPTFGTWQKFYLALKDFIAQTKGTSYSIYIKASLDPNLSSGQVLLRNIQLVHY